MSEDGVIGVDKNPSGYTQPGRLKVAAAVVLIAAAAVFGVIRLIDLLSTSDEEAIASVFTDYYGAIADRDGAEACGFLTDGVRRRLLLVPGQPNAPSALSCTKAIGVATRLLPKGQLEDLGRIDAEKVEEFVDVDGDRATIVLDNNGRRSRTALRRVDGRWLIAALG